MKLLLALLFAIGFLGLSFAANEDVRPMNNNPNGGIPVQAERANFNLDAFSIVFIYIAVLLIGGFLRSDFYTQGWMNNSKH